MSNEYKISRKLVLLSDNPLTLPVAASDPGSASNGDLYYNSVSHDTKVHANGVWTGFLKLNGTSGMAANLQMQSIGTITPFQFAVGFGAANNVNDITNTDPVTNTNVTTSAISPEVGGYAGVFTDTSGGVANLVYLDPSSGTTVGNIGTGEFTIEAWIQVASIGAYYQPILHKGDPFTNTNSLYALYVTPSGNIVFDCATSGGSIQISCAAPIGPWFHIVLQHKSGGYQIILDGVLQTNLVSGDTPIGEGPISSYLPLLVGKLCPNYPGITNSDQVPNYLHGAIDAIRIVKGKGAYDYLASFTPPVPSQVASTYTYQDYIQYQIKNLLDGTSAQDAINKGQLDALQTALSAEDLTLLKLDGSRTMTGNLLFSVSGNTATFAPNQIYVADNGQDASFWFGPSAANYYTNFDKGTVLESIDASYSNLTDTSIASKKIVLGSELGVSLGSINFGTYVYTERGTITEDGSDMKIAATASLKLDGSYVNILSPAVKFTNGVDYWELSTLTTAPLSDNTTDNVFTIPYSEAEYIVIDYSIVRGSTKETGTIHMVADSSQVNVTTTSSYIGATGVKFSGDNVGGTTVRLRYTTTSTGSGATMKYVRRKWK